MFERYTEKAMRTIFFGRYEASQFGSPSIESEHLLLGLLRENESLANMFLHSTVIREKVSTSVDVPISPSVTNANVSFATPLRKQKSFRTSS